MRPFIINEEIKEQFAALVAYAEAHPLNISRMIEINEGEAMPPAKIKGHNVVTQFGYHVILTIENQLNGTKARHLSVSVPTVGNMPNPAIVAEIMKLTGFIKGIDECLVEMEHIGHGHDSISVVEIMPL